MTDISHDAMDDLRSLLVHQCAAVLAMPTPLTSIAEITRQAETAIFQLRKALDEAHRSGWNDAIEAAVDYLEPSNPPEDWTDYARDQHYNAIAIRALPYKPQEDVSDG